MAKEIDIQQKTAKTYEVGYLLTPFMPAEQVEEAVEAMYKLMVSDLGGQVAFKTSPKMRPLAYPVSKIINNKKSTVREAYFGAVKFELSPEQIRSLKDILDKNDNIIRYLVVSLPKNSDRAFAPRRVLVRREEKTVVNYDSGEEKKSEEMSKADIDKEIEGLLDETSK